MRFFISSVKGVNLTLAAGSICKSPLIIIYIEKLGCGEQTADADFGSTKVVDIVYFYLCIDASAFFEEAAAFIGRNRIAAAAEAYKLNQMHIRILGNIFGCRIQAAVIGPLVEHLQIAVEFLGLNMTAYGILTDEGSAHVGNQAVDTVVDLGVDVIGTACQYNDRLMLFACLGDDFLSFSLYLCFIVIKGSEGSINSLADFLLGDIRVGLGKHFLQFLTSFFLWSRPR